MGKTHDHVIFVAGGDDVVIPDRTAGLGHVADPGTVSPFDVVAKGEEGIRSQGNPVQGIEILADLLVGQRLRSDGEVLLPVAFGGDVFFVLIDVAVNDVVPIRPGKITSKGQIKHPVALS